MQADYALCRDIMRACHEAQPNPLHFGDLCRQFPDRDHENIPCHIQVFEDESFLEDRKPCSASNPALEPVQYVRLSHPLAADRFLKRAKGPVS